LTVFYSVEKNCFLMCCTEALCITAVCTRVLMSFLLYAGLTHYYSC